MAVSELERPAQFQHEFKISFIVVIIMMLWVFGRHMSAQVQAAAQSSLGLSRASCLLSVDYADLLVIASVNNTAGYDSTDGKTIIGDASETALLRFKFCNSYGVVEYYRNAYRVLHTVPFSSATKFSAVICESDAFPGQHLVMLKGAPEIVLTK